MNTRKKSIIILFIFTISVLLMFSSLLNAQANQTDSDLEVTLHGHLNSNSAEVSSNLMPVGTYTYFETPEFDVGDFNHDVSLFNLQNIQYSNQSIAGAMDYEISKGVNDTTGNHSILFTDIPYYELGAGFDTFIMLDENYTVSDYINYSNSPYGKALVLHETFDVNAWNLVGVNPVMTITSYCSHDAFVVDNFPNNNYGSDNGLEVAHGANEYWTYVGSTNRLSSYLTDNQTSESQYEFYVSSALSSYVIDSYATSLFDEMVVTWNNKPSATTGVIGTLTSTGTGWRQLPLGNTYYDYYVFKPHTGTGWVIFRSDESSYRPLIFDYYSKVYQNAGNIYAQTNVAGDLLTLQSPVYSATTNLRAGDYLSIDLKPKCDDQLNMSLILNGVVQKNLQIVAQGNSDQNQRIINVTVDSDVSFNQIKVFGTLENTEYFRLYDIKAYNYVRGDFVKNIYIKNFNYQILGIDYYENYTLIWDSGDYDSKIGNCSYHFDSSMFSHYNYINDVIIPNQDLTIVIELALKLDTDVDFNLSVSYSTGVWRIPSDIDMQLNGYDISDETYNSGYVFLNDFPNMLTFTSNQPAFFKFNSTTDFSFTFNLDIISRTHLEKQFELLSNHPIYFDRIDLSDNLNIKIMYLNNIDKGNSNPNILSPSVSMNTGNKFKLIVILAEEIYIPLQYIYSDLGIGTSNIYFSGISNTYKYYDLTRFNFVNLIPPNQMLTEYALLQFSNLQYLPYYQATPANNTYSYSSANDTYSQESVVYDNEYTQTSANGTKIGESNPTGIEYDDEIESFTNVTTEAGYYYGDLSEFKQSVGTNGTNIWWVHNTTMNATIINEFQGHKNAVKCTTQDSSTYQITYNMPSHELGVPGILGLRQFWFATNDTTSGWTGDFSFYDSSVRCFRLIVANGHFEYYNGGWQNAGAFASNTWILLRMDWYINNTWDCYANNMIMINNTPMYHNMTLGINIIKHFHFSSPSISYIDSWDNCVGMDDVLINDFQGHKNILKCTSYDATIKEVYCNFTEHKFTGTTEFWFASPNVTVGWIGDFSFYDSSVQCFRLIVADGYFIYHNGSAWVNAGNWVANIWMHLRITWYANNRWECYLNEVRIVDNNPMFHNMTLGINRFVHYHFLYASITYIDGFGSSFNPNYKLGFNKNPCDIVPLLSSLNFYDDYFKLNNSLKIESNLYNRTDVLKCYDGSSTTNWKFKKAFSVTKGTIEFWILTNNTRKLTSLMICNGSSATSIYAQIYLNKFEYYDTAWHTIVTLTNNTWYYVEIEFDCPNNHWHCWVNGIGGSAFSFRGSPTIMEYLLIGSYSSDKDYVFCIDTILFFLDNTFYTVQYLWITDSIVASHQLFTVYWKAQDNNVSHVIISNKFQTITQNIYNITLINNTLQSKTWFNESSGFYILNFTFYDTHLNWELWTLNFTLYSGICISLAYKNPVFVLESNNVSVHVQSADGLYQIYRDNSSTYIKQWQGSAYSYEFSFLVVYSNKTTYNISVLAKSLQGDSFYINVSGICVIKRSTEINIHGMKQSYLQSEYIDMSVSLNDIYNNPIYDAVRYHLYDPSTADVMNGAVASFVGAISFGLDITWTQGYYHLNCSYPETDQYCVSWEMMSFEIFPIERPTDSYSIGLRVNGNSVINNTIQVNYTNLLTLSSTYDNLTFDLDIYCLFNHSHAISYSEYLSDSFIFTPSSQFTSIQIVQANLTNVPTNFTQYYFDTSLSTNYILRGNNLQITDIIGDYFYNGNDFDVMLSFYQYSKRSVQLTANPTTEDDSVVFEEYLYANRSFSYWYFVDNLEINSVSLNHIRTGTTINSFVVNGSLYYFDESCLSGDQFVATKDYKLRCNVSFTYTTTGVTSTLTIRYKAMMAISNMSMIVDLSTVNLWMDSWDHNGTQNPNTLKLTIPNTNFTSSYQTLTLHGVSSVPHCNFASFEPQDIVMVDGSDTKYTYYGFIEYSTYSQYWLLQGIKNEWILDGVHYWNSIMTINKNIGYFRSVGFDDSITESYLKFDANPIDEYYIEDNNVDTITINVDCNLPVGMAIIFFTIPSVNKYKFNTNLQNLTLIVTLLGEDYYMFTVDGLSVGNNKIEINYTVYNVANVWVLILLMIIMSIAVVVFYWYTKRKEILKEVETMSPTERRKYYREMYEKGGILTQYWRQFKDLFRRKSPQEKARIKKAQEEEELRKKIEKPRVL